MCEQCNRIPITRGQEFYHILFVLKIENFKSNDRTVMLILYSFAVKKTTRDQC